MDAAGNQKSERLHRLYENRGESAVQDRRDEVERQRDRVREELRETTNKYLTALAADQESKQLIEDLSADDDLDTSDPIGNFRGFVQPLPTVWGAPKLRNLKIRDDDQIPDHVQNAIRVVEQDNDGDQDECSSGYWRREETAVTAITEDEKIVFQISPQESVERLQEEAEEACQKLRDEVEDRHHELEQLEQELNRHEDFLSKVYRGEVEPNEKPPTSEVKRRELRGIADKHTEEVKAVYEYLDGRPEQALPDSRTAVFNAVFPDEEGRTAYERFRCRWERADLTFPSTVEELYEECKIALELREEFPVESP